MVNTVDRNPLYELDHYWAPVGVLDEPEDLIHNGAGLGMLSAFNSITRGHTQAYRHSGKDGHNTCDLWGHRTQSSITR